ncbi:hypothetical protein SAMN05421820_11622 [Pedobacter steynii]|uniref:Outer membrane protein beta-barrel domain-containing protein n=1 Tax=Pedobacter steynii TaxID=430522 RepID=A0A1H0KD97_9SPHI|nr:hypothetical protein [Pedobacter steynii]NQX43260.1 hypothetical protein [Pedobacter steynii]SDO53915.1 hypothetical protein SAMN05421820_11622 [Pedobacter steynii]
MKKILTTLLISSCLLNVTAQNSLLSIGTGINIPGKTIKENTGLDNGYGFNGNLYVPLFTKSFSIGFNAGGEYFTGNKRHELNSYTPFQITGQSSNPAIGLTNLGSPKQSGFKAEGGAQANLTFGPVTISPILNAGYFSMKQKGFSATQTSTVNGKTNEYNLYSQAETKTTGFVIIPKLRFSYFPGKFGFYVEGAYSNGPTVKNESMVFKPQGNADAQGFYNIDQMLTGTRQPATKNTTFNSLAFNLGISLALGKSNSEKETRRETTAPQARGEKEIKSTEQINDDLDAFAGLPLIKLEGRTDDRQECKPVIRYPRQGQRFGEKDPINLRVHIPTSYTGEKSIRIYKISDDEDYLSKLNPGERAGLSDRMSLTVNTLLEQSGKNKPFVKSLTKNGNEYSSVLDGLEKGSYMALVGADNCHANPVSFIIGSGLHRLDVLIDTARCKGFNAAGQPVYTIAITLKNFSTAAENITYDFNNAANIAQNAAIPGNLIANIVYAGANGTISLSAGTYPASLAPGVQQTFSIDYTPANVNATCLNLNVYTSSLQGNATVNDNTFYCTPVIQCACNYCDLIKWEFSKDKVTATTQLTNNSISLSTTITAPNVNIKNFKAELISFTHVSVNGTEECFSCNKDSQTFGNFSSGTFTSAGWGTLNGLFPVIPAGGGNTHHTLSWFSLSPPVTALSGSKIDLNISAPPFSTLACCDDVIRFCIRYSFTNEDCQSCSFVKCYQVTRKHK